MTGRWRGHGIALAALTVIGFTIASGCTSDTAPSSEPTGAGSPSGVAAPTIPVADEQAIRVAIDRVNATAGGRVTAQRSALAAGVDPLLAAALDQCPAATSTLRFEPIYRELRAAPGWAAPSGSLTGTVYALPSLVRIYTGERITGTDLTTVHLGVYEGEAYLTPLCVG